FSIARWLSNLRCRPRSTLFPYTTLFRSTRGGPRGWRIDTPGTEQPWGARAERHAARSGPARDDGTRRIDLRSRDRHDEPGAAARSEEHTSELQSRENLVCRLLLEKKK